MSNPFNKKIGFSESDRLVIFHTDDIGMCQASIQAFQDLWEFGTISSGAVMVPCPWFPKVAEMCRNNPAIDMGIHATLNSEWEAYRWGPISTGDRDSGLFDKDGYFNQWHEAVFENAKPEAVALELHTQVNRALAAGIDATHIDSHMGTIMHPKFIRQYLAEGVAQNLPVMLPKRDGHEEEMTAMGAHSRNLYQDILREQEQKDLPIIDRIVGMPLEHAQDHIGVAKKLINDLPAGITHFLFHPSIDSPELRMACPDWPARVANYEAFMSRELKEFIQKSDVHVIGYRVLRDAIRASKGK